MHPPAVAVLEFGSVAAGIKAADAMLKRAPISLFKAGTVHPGRYVIVMGGSVASVEEAYREGRAASPAFLMDDVFLPDVHPEVFETMLAARHTVEHDAVGIVETRSVASIVRGADAAIKGAKVRIVELRMADDLGGNSFVVFDGLIGDVQTAVSIGSDRAGKELLSCVTIPRIDATMRQAISAGTAFRPCALLQPEDADRAVG